MKNSGTPIGSCFTTSVFSTEPLRAIPLPTTPVATIPVPTAPVQSIIVPTPDPEVTVVEEATEETRG